MMEKLTVYLLHKINFKNAAYRYWLMMFLITIIPQIRIAEIKNILPSENKYNFWLILNYTKEITTFSIIMGFLFIIDCLIEYYLFNSNREKNYCNSYIGYKIGYKTLVIIVLIVLISYYAEWLTWNFLKDYYASISIIFIIMIFFEMDVYLKILSNFPSNPILGNELERIKLDIDLCSRLIIYFFIICQGVYIFQNTFFNK